MARFSLTCVRLLDPFAEADEDTGETKQSQNYIHIRIQRTSPFFCSASSPSAAALPYSIYDHNDTENDVLHPRT